MQKKRQLDFCFISLCMEIEDPLGFVRRHYNDPAITVHLSKYMLHIEMVAHKVQGYLWGNGLILDTVSLPAALLLKSL